MAVLAVLDIHIESIAVGSINPNRTNLGEPPTIKRTFNPILLQIVIREIRHEFVFLIPKFNFLNKIFDT